VVAPATHHLTRLPLPWVLLGLPAHARICSLVVVLVPHVERARSGYDSAVSTTAMNEHVTNKDICREV
jgi:hypothetical protein